MKGNSALQKRFERNFSLQRHSQEAALLHHEQRFQGGRENG
jgi:hypothetical protein